MEAVFSAIRHKKNNNIKARNNNNNCTMICPHKMLMERVKLIIIIQVARFLVVRFIVLLRSQRCRSSPNQRLCKRNWWNRGELSAKQAAESIIKGVVGNIGKITPIKPKIKNRLPKARKTIRLKFFFIPMTTTSI